MMLAMPSAPWLSLGLADVGCAWHADGQRSGLPTKLNLMSAPLIVACVCQPQYCEQKPLLSPTSADDRTKYTPLVSLGSLPEVIALETTACTPASLNTFPCE